MKTLIEELEVHASISLHSVKFYQTKFMLIDSVLKDSSYQFTSTSKACLLVLCKELIDWFTALFEATFKCETDSLDTESKDRLLLEFCEALQGFTNKVMDYDSSADSRILDMCNRLMGSHIEGLKEIVTKKLSYPPSFAFADLNNFLIRFIKHTKKIVHEVDYIQTCHGTDEFDPFISIDIVDLTMYQDLRISMPSLRLKAYMESKLICCGGICVKSYVDAAELDSNHRLSDSFEAIIESIKADGFTIFCII
ncbi:MAG: hypothetical protein ACRC6V_09505 [Bacteroidales bacterium]